MNVNQNISPLVAFIFIAAVSVCGLVFFWSVGEGAKARAGSYFLESDKQGNLSIQVDHMLMRVTPEGGRVSVTDLSELGGNNLMGNIAYFSNGDIVIRSGGSEEGLKSYFSLAQILKPKTLTADSQAAVESWRAAERFRQEWVKTGLLVESQLNRCNIVSGECQVLVEHDVPWRYRIFIDDHRQQMVLSEGTAHLVRVMDFKGAPIGHPPLNTLFPKRVRSADSGYYVVDTNFHRVVFFNSDIKKHGDIKNQNILPSEPEGREWPLDAIYFDEHWWVINADGQMTNGHLLKFDKAWSFVGRVVLPEGADPFDMIVFNDQLIVSDIGLGGLFTFESSEALAGAMVLDSIPEYFKALEGRRQYFEGIQENILLFLIVFIPSFFACLILKERWQRSQKAAGLSDKSLLITTEVGPERVIYAQLSYCSMVIKVATARRLYMLKRSLRFRCRALVKFGLYVLSGVGALLVVLTLLPLGLCRANYTLGFALLAFFAVVVLLLKKEEKITEAIFTRIIRFVAEARAEQAFKGARRAIPYIARYQFEGGRVSYLREKDGCRATVWSKRVFGEYYFSEGILLVYRENVIYPDLLILVDSPDEIIEYLDELGLHPIDAIN